MPLIQKYIRHLFHIGLKFGFRYRIRKLVILEYDFAFFINFGAEHIHHFVGAFFVNGIELDVLMLFVKLFGAVFVELSEHSAASHMVAI